MFAQNTRQHEPQRLFALASDEASIRATEKRLARCETGAKHAATHRASSASEALAEVADQPLGYSHSLMPTASAHFGHKLPPQFVRSVGPSPAHAPSSQTDQVADANIPTVPVKTTLPVQAGLFTRLLQGAHDTLLKESDAAAQPNTHYSAGGIPVVHPQSPHSQQTNQQQRQEVTVQTTMSGQHHEQTPQSPSQGLKAMFASCPAVSCNPSRKRILDPTGRSDKHHKSHHTKAEQGTAARIQQAFPHRKWQTLSDVLQDLDINSITFMGMPMTRDQGLSAVAGPATPAFLPEQYVGACPLAYLHNQPASPAQPTQTPPTPCPAAGLVHQRPPLYTPWQLPTQLQQQHYTASVSQLSAQREQAAGSALPLLLCDLAASRHDATYVAAPAQQLSAATPTVRSPCLPHHGIPVSQGAFLQHPLHRSQLGGRSSHSSGGTEEPQESSNHSVALALDRLFSRTAAQPTTSVQRRSRQAQPAPAAGRLPSSSVDQRSAYNPIQDPASISQHDDIQHGQWPAASNMYAAPKAASSLPPVTPAAVPQGAAQTGVLGSQQQRLWLQPISHLQAPFLQQDVHQPPFLAVPAAPLRHDDASEQLQPDSLQHQSPSLPSLAMQVTRQQEGLNSALPPARPLHTYLDSCLGASDRHNKQQQLANNELAGPSTASDKPYQSRCSPSASSRSQSDPGSFAIIAGLPLCSPERMSAASSALCSSPVLMWNSPASSPASLPMTQQGRRDTQPSTSIGAPVQQQNSQHQQQPQQQQQQEQQQLDSNPHTAMQDSRPLLVVPSRISSASVIHRPPESLDIGKCLAASVHMPSRPAEVPPPSSAARAHLFAEQGQCGKHDALEEILLSAKRVLRSLELAVDLHAAHVHDRVMPFSSHVPPTATACNCLCVVHCLVSWQVKCHEAIKLFLTGVQP